MSAGLVWGGEVYGWSDGPRGFSCMAHLTGEPCRADVGLCDLCTMDLYCLLEAFVPLLLPQLDAAAAECENTAAVRRGLHQVLLEAAGLLVDPVEATPPEERAWELLAELDPPVRTAAQLADGLRGVVVDSGHEPRLAVLADDLRAALVMAEAVLRGRL